MNERKEHDLTFEVLDRFAARQATPEERGAVLRHLLAGCERCQGYLRMVGWHGPVRELAVRPIDSAYDAAFAAAERAATLALQRKHLPASLLLAELDKLPRREQELRVRNMRRYASAALSAAYVEQSHAARFDNHQEMLRFSRLAVAVAEAATPVDAGGHSMLSDCRARAWGQLANAHRIRSQLSEASREFDHVLGLLDEGTGDPALRAWVLYHLSSLRLSQRDFQAAKALLEEVVEIYRGLHDRAGEAGALIKLALSDIHAGDPQPAVESLHRALRLVAPHAIDLLRAGVHNLVYCYLELGEAKQAYALLADAGPHFWSCRDQVMLLRTHWLRGKVERDLRLYEAAEIRLLRVREDFARQDLSFEVAVVSLDLAELYALQRRGRDVERTVGEAIPIFKGLGVTRDLLASLLKLREIAHERGAALALIRQVLAEVKGGLPQADDPAARGAG